MSVMTWPAVADHGRNRIRHAVDDLRFRFRGGKRVIPPVVLIGYPFDSTGRGQHLRAIHRALSSIDVNPAVYNLRPQDEREIESEAFRSDLVEEVPANSIRIFHCNGDQAAGVITELEKRQNGILEKGFNIIFPAWELPSYPEPWARALDCFDEVWTASTFVHEAIKPAVRVPVIHLPNACQPHIEQPLSRDHFGLRENAYVVLLFFDLWSYTTRKNPWASIACFKQVLAARSKANLQFVIKMNHGTFDPAVRSRLEEELREFGETAILIDRTTNDNEAKNLIECCDCFISLHRSEGFGRGPAEAMFLAKPAIATGWSGNMEYMSDNVSFPVSYQLIPVVKGEYLFEEGQVWAEPDVAEAAEILIKLIDDRDYGVAIGQKAQRHMLGNFGDAVLARRYRRRFLEIARSREFIVTGGTSVLERSAPSPPGDREPLPKA